MAQDDIYRVTLQWLQPTLDVAQLVFHYRQVTAGDPTIAAIQAAIAANFLVGWALIDDRIDGEVTGDFMQLALYDPGADEFNTVNTTPLGAAFDGALAGAQGGFQQAVCVKFLTNVAKSIGKKFLFGFGRDNFADDVVVVAGVAECLAAGIIWAADVVASGVTFRPGNWVRATGGFRDWTGDVLVQLNESSQDGRRTGFGV